MKKIILLLTFSFALFNCDKPKIIPGITGNPVYLVAEVESVEDTAGCTYNWTFQEIPDGSNMDVLSLQPDSKSYNPFFVPDIEGEYTLEYRIIDAEGKDKINKTIICEVSEDTTQQEEIAPSETTATELEQIVDIPKPVYEESEPRRTISPKPAPKIIKGKNIPLVKGKYTIQISSWKDYAKAELAVAKLKDMNLDAYIQTAHFDETNETWYRVRTGTFNSFVQAKEAKIKLKRKIKTKDIWIDYIRKD